MAFISKRQAEIQESKEYYKRAIECYDKNIHFIKSSINILYDNTSQYKEMAECLIKKADISTIIKKENEAVDDYSEAIKLMLEVIEYNRKFEANSEQESNYQYLSGIYIKRGNTYLSVKSYAKCLEDFHAAVYYMEQQITAPDSKVMDALSSDRENVYTQIINTYSKIYIVHLRNENLYEACKVLKLTMDIYLREFSRDADFESQLLSKCREVESIVNDSAQPDQIIIMCLYMIVDIKKEISGQESTELSKTYVYIASYYRNKHDFQEAEKYFQCALSIEEKSSNGVSLITILNSLGNLAVEKCDYNKALGWFGRSLPLIEEEFGEESSIYSSIKSRIDEISGSLAKETI